MLIVVLWALTGCSSSDSDLQSLSGPTMGTTWSVQLTDLPPNLSRDKLATQITATLDEVNQAMSTYIDDSEVVLFNRYTGTDWFPVSTSVVTVLAEALVISQLSDGAFDITVNPLVDLWGFGAAGIVTTRPSNDAIDSLLARIGYQQLEVQLNPPALRKKIPELSIDLSAIAKGYAVDRVAQLLQQHGSQNFLVEIGGELRASGHNARNTPWSIGVERPDRLDRQVEQLLPLRDVSVATSGDYRNFFEADGRHYSHTIDPRTGEPVVHNLASVSVLADTSMRADALATAFLVMGPDTGPALARREDIAAMFIERNGDGYNMTMSPALQLYLDDISGAAVTRHASTGQSR